MLERFSVLEDVPRRDDFGAMLNASFEKLANQLTTPSQVHVCETQEETYTEIVRTINRANAEVRGQKEMWHAILHGSALPKGAPELPAPSYLKEFDDSVGACVRSAGKDRWYVRQFYNVTTLTRLDIVKGRVGWPAEAYEVKAVCAPGLIPCFSPLIIGEQDAFLAIIDSAGYRVGASIHLRGREATRLVTQYFRDLWQAGEFDLRDAVGVRMEEAERLERTIHSLTN